MYIGLHSYPILVKPEFSVDTFSKNTQMSNLMKIRSVETELFHEDRQTGRFEEIIVSLRNCFANATK